MADTQLKIAPIGEGISLKARAYEALKTAIMNMNIYADDAELRLDERDLSQRFGVSRTPLREALAQLDQEGLVRIVARRGIFIVRKTKAEILDMITVWAALESMAARLATKEARRRGAQQAARPGRPVLPGRGRAPRWANTPTPTSSSIRRSSGSASAR